MICLLQRASHGQVTVNQSIIGQIGQGLVVLVGFQPNDDLVKLDKMAQKMLNYRLFSDTDGKMNLNVQQVDGDLLLVPQFTLAADTHSGLRPSFSSSAKPELARKLFHEFIALVETKYKEPKTGEFGADMQVSLTNDGPVTFWLEV